MSPKKDFVRYPCPCGEGEYQVTYGVEYYMGLKHMPDARYEMLCPECKEKYVYTSTIGMYLLRDILIREWIKIDPGDIIPRAWVLKSDFSEVNKKEKKFRKDVEIRAKELYYAKWQNCFKNATNEKEIWEILTLKGKYYPTLATFLKETKIFNKEEILRKYFHYYNLKIIFDICKLEPDWEYLVSGDNEIKQLFLENLKKIIKLKLKIEPIPPSTWNNNLRKYTDEEEWNKVRKKVFDDYEYKCGICGVKKNESELNCHEIWEYDDKRLIQKLVGLISLCKMCHNVKHIASSEKFGLDKEELVAHFMKINNCDRKAFETHKKFVFDTLGRWERQPFEIRKKFEYVGERSKHEWSIDLGEYGQDNRIHRMKIYPVNPVNPV